MARPETVSSSELADRIGGVFRSRGYDGASLADLSAASGLAKAALYHRFVEGKPAMAMAVLEASDLRFLRDVLSPLRADASPEKRFEAMAKGLASFYAKGANSCLVELFSVAGTPDEVSKSVAGGAAAWIDAIAEALGDAGFTPETAQRRAEDAVIRIQGALVLSRALSDTGPFCRTLETLPAALLANEAV